MTPKPEEIKRRIRVDFQVLRRLEADGKPTRKVEERISKLQKLQREGK